MFEHVRVDDLVLMQHLVEKIRFSSWHCSQTAIYVGRSGPKVLGPSVYVVRLPIPQDLAMRGENVHQ